MMDAQQFSQQFLSDSPPALAKTYLFYGQNPFLSEENAQLVISAAKNSGFNQRQIFYIDNRSQFQTIVDELNSPGLFDPKKLFELRFDTDNPNKKVGEQVAKIAQHNSVNIMLIQAGNLAYKVQKESWFQSLIKNSHAVFAKPIYSNQLPNWIHQRATFLGVSLTGDALKMILQYSEGNLLWTNQILMQLKHSDYPQPIAVDVIEKTLADRSVFRVEDLLNALFNKDKQVVKIVDKLQQENESLIFITTILATDLQMLQKIQQSGLGFSQACSQFRVWKNKQRLYQSAFNQYSHHVIEQAIRKLALLDKINKGQQQGDGWMLLRHLIGQMIF